MICPSSCLVYLHAIYLYLQLCLSIYLSIYLPVYLIIYLFVSLSMNQPIYLSIYLPFSLFVSLYLSISLSLSSLYHLSLCSKSQTILAKSLKLGYAHCHQVGEHIENV